VSSTLSPVPFFSPGIAVAAGGVDFADSSLAVPVELEPGCGLVCDDVELLCREESALLFCESGLDFVLVACEGAPTSGVADGGKGAVFCGGNFVAEGAVGSCCGVF